MLKVVPNKSQQEPDIQTEKSIVQFINNILKPFRGLSAQFWANFFFFCLLFTLMGSNGMSFLAFYMVDIFEKVKGKSLKNHPHFPLPRRGHHSQPPTPPGSPPALRSSAPSLPSMFSTALKGKTVVFSSNGNMVFTKNVILPRRRLFISTGTLVFMAFASLSMFTQLVDKGWLDEAISRQINFLPMVSVILAYVGVGLGFLVIPVLIAAETIPVEVRSTTFGVFSTLEMLSTFFISKLKPTLMEKLDLAGLFALFAGER